MRNRRSKKFLSLNLSFSSGLGVTMELHDSDLRPGETREERMIEALKSEVDRLEVAQIARRWGVNKDVVDE